MTTRSSQGDFGAALRSVADDIPIVVYKPPDDARNMKPCDYMAWFRMQASGITRPWLPEAAWFECKDVDAVSSFPFSELRPSQQAGIRDAQRVGIPYWLAVYWRRDRRWTISDAALVLDWKYNSSSMGAYKHPTSIPRELLASRFGLDSTPGNLGSTLKAILRGEV